jgi:tetratricopeptide (TPR) repeat protein
MSKQKKNTPPAVRQVVSQPTRKAEPTRPKVPQAVINVRYNHWLAGAAALMALALFSNTFFHDYVLDDAAAILYNNYVQEGISGIPKLMKVDFWYFMNLSLGYYRPLSLITFAIEHQFFGNNPQVSHIGNVAFYALTAYLLCLLLQRWFYAQNPLYAFLITLIFVVHPVHTEVVANIKSRDELLSFLNATATLLLFTTYLDTHKTKYLLWSCLTFYLAYLSKESSITTLGIIPLVAYFLRGQSIGASLAKVLPYLGVTIIFFIQKLAMLGTLGGKPPMDLMVYPYFVEKTRFLSMFKQLAHYIRLLVTSYPQVYDYSYNQIPSGSVSDPVTWLGISAFFGLIYLTYRGIRARSVWGFALALFFATLFPALAFTVSRGGIMAERFLYSPVLGWSILLVWGLFTLIKQANAGQEGAVNWLKTNMLPLGMLVLMMGLFGFRTYERNAAWANEITLFRADNENTQNNSNARKHIGDSTIKEYQAEKDPKKKAQLFKEGVENLHKAINIFPNYGEAYFGLGFAYHHGYPQPNLDSAKYYYRRAIATTPRFVVSYNNLGVIHEMMGRKDLASYWYNMAVRVNPNYQNSVNNQQRLLKEGINVQFLPDSVLNRY